MTEVRLSKDPGLPDKAVFDQLMAHLMTAAGLELRASDGSEHTPTGFWQHLASFDPAAPPGCARLYLASHAEVARVHETLHGQVLQVGNDWLLVTVHNDILEASALAGNSTGAPPSATGRPGQ